MGSRLFKEVERHASDRGVTRLRLDTRSDLTVARRLYERHGYVEVAPFNDGRWAQHWYNAKPLG